jgi:hypothetical protein
MFNPRHLSHQNLVVMDAAKKEYRIKHALGTAAGDDRAVRGSSKGGCAMGRKTAALGLRLIGGFVLAAMFVAANFVSTPAAAQGNCPPGQVFVPVENKCVGLGGVVPAQRCPQGQEFDQRENRCVAAGQGVRCPQGQEFDESTNRCVTAGRGVRCPQGQEFDERTNRCVTAGRGVRCPQGQEFDERANRCVVTSR